MKYSAREFRPTRIGIRAASADCVKNRCALTGDEGPPITDVVVEEEVEALRQFNYTRVFAFARNRRVFNR